MPKTIGLDLSLRATGICILSGDTMQTLDMKLMMLRRESVSGIRDSILRLTGISDDIANVVEAESPDIVIIEAAAKNQVWQAAAIGELHGVVKMKLWERLSVIPMVEQATRIRKHVIGQINSTRKKVLNKKGKLVNKVDYGTIIGKNGKPKAATVKDVVELRLKEQGLVFSTQDEADAYVCARFAWDSLKQG